VLKALHPVKPGPVKAAIRPETWIVGRAGEEGVAGVVAKQAYLGSVYELTVDTALGAIFVVSTDVEHPWALGDALTLRLPASGISVVPV
jgi:iron(III) transport system ATP-binding protein